MRATIQFVEHDRFDDVEFRIVEGPEPPPRNPRRRRHVVFALTVSALAVGMLAAGASALTGSDETAVWTGPAAKSRAHYTTHYANGAFRPHGNGCHRREGRPAAAPLD